MPLDNIIFPKAFQLGSRDPARVRDFQVAILESAKRASSLLTHKRIARGQMVFRNASEKYMKDPRRVPPHASESLTNRWSGSIASTTFRHGALYTSEDLNGFVNEAMRYNRIGHRRSVPWKGDKAEYTVFGPASSDYSKLLVGQVYYGFTVDYSIDVLNATPEDAPRFYAHIEADKSYQAAKNALGLSGDMGKLVANFVDYTASRPVGLSVLLGSSAEGLRVRTAQNEAVTPGNGGYNLVLRGDDGAEISYLRLKSRFIAGNSGGQSALMETDASDSSAVTGDIVPGSVISIPK
jgi:hypothetical protein